jgi:hypothetical protein
MSNKTIINYKVQGCRMYEIPIITINPNDNNNINIKFKFPDIDEINIDINNNSNIVIKQSSTEPYPNMNLLVNDKIINTKQHFYNNGTIIITSNNKCDYNETYEMFYDS